MQIGIDLGATKIESVLLKENGLELHRDRIQSPKNYQKTISDITNIVNNIEKKFKKNLNVGICHPGSTNLETGFIQNAFNSPWLNNQTFSKDISKSLNRNVYCENDANCFALSEAFDGSAKNFKTVFGIILGSGCGGGLVIDKKIIIGPNSFTGEWGHIPIGKPDSGTNIEEYISGKGLERNFTAKFNKNILNVVNKICNSNFQTKNFDHKAFYNLKKNRVEMHLISKKNFMLKINKKNIKFTKDETIHTENSHKYSKNNFVKLVNKSVFKVLKYFSDKKNYFGVFLLKVK